MGCLADVFEEDRCAMRALSTVIPPETEECSTETRRRVFAAMRKHDRPLTVGQQILYVEVKLFPIPHLVNCVVTVRENDV